MKNLTYLFGLFILILTSWQTSNDKSSKNSIPYPLEEWKGVQGKTLADSNHDFVASSFRIAYAI